MQITKRFVTVGKFQNVLKLPRTERNQETNGFEKGSASKLLKLVLSFQNSMPFAKTIKDSVSPLVPYTRSVHTCVEMHGHFAIVTGMNDRAIYEREN